MHDTAATLDSRQPQQIANAMEKSVETIRGRKVKFTYPSGAKPLPGYTIKRGIGTGGFGEVYFALSDAGKEVALKKIQRNLDVELRGVRQCLNLKHINLISLWDICTNDHGESWVVMEYVPGDSLRDLIERYPLGMTTELADQWFHATAAGVSYLHNHGIVHRDLKPGNIFFDDDQQVIKIGDYGLSKFISCSKRSGQTESVGTFHYMAPEIGKGVYGKEIDIYAIGVILFEMLTGRVPYEGESSQEIIMKHLTADPDVDRVPEPYRKVIRRALRKDPEKRYSTIDAMLEEYPGDVTPNYFFKTKSSPSTSPGIRNADAEVVPAEVESIKRVPPTIPIEPVFIGEQPEIVFGELRDTHVPEVVEAEQIDVVDASAMASRVPDEPIARAVHHGWHRVVNSWNQSKLKTPIKVLILVVLGIGLISNSAWLLPIALSLGLVYLVYYAIRAWRVSPTRARRAGRPRRMSRAEINTQLRETLKGQSVSQRLGELTSSLLLSAIACLMFAFLGTTLTGSGSASETETWSIFAWLSLTATAGSWALLIAGKLWEERDGDPMLRRLSMLGLGLGVGGASFLLSQWLATPVFGAEQRTMFEGAFHADFDNRLIDGEGNLMLPAFLIFFGLLFVVLRWWRQSDPVRKTRLSLWAVGVCLIWAILFADVFRFPTIAACVVALSIAASTQLAAPWISSQRRQQVENLQTA